MCQLLPHPPNVSPIEALALWGSAVVANKRAAFLVPLTALFLSDLALGLMGGNLSRGSIGYFPLWMEVLLCMSGILATSAAPDFADCCSHNGGIDHVRPHQLGCLGTG